MSDLILAESFTWDPDINNFRINGEPLPFYVSPDVPAVYEPGYGRGFGILYMPIVVDDLDQFEVDLDGALYELEEQEKRIQEAEARTKRNRAIGTVLAWVLPVLAVLATIIVLGVAFR